MTPNLLLSLGLRPGKSARINCPECGGYHTLSVTHKGDHIAWRCFKALCYERGARPVAPTFSSLTSAYATKNLFVPPKFSREPHWTSVFSNERAVKFVSKWKLMRVIEDGLGEILWDPRLERVVFLCFKDDELVDAVGRTVQPKVKPKWYRYGSSRYGFLCAVERSGEGMLVLVEDCISAAAVGLAGYDALALLGTHVTSEVMASLRGRHVVLMLDPDATSKSLDLASKLCFVARKVSVVMLRDDPKYMSGNEIRAYLEELK